MYYFHGLEKAKVKNFAWGKAKSIYTIYKIFPLPLPWSRVIVIIFKYLKYTLKKRRAKRKGNKKNK